VTEFSGVVLAGGKSKRFGSDKTRFIYQGKTMMQWVLESLQDSSERFIIANQPYDEFNVSVYADVISSQTPLSGIHSALIHAKYDWVAVAACDMPYLTKAYWQVLHSHCKNSQAIVVESHYGLEPLAAFYHKSLVGRLETYLQNEQRAIHVFLQEVELKILSIDFLNIPHNTFTNINSLSDLDKTEKL
jgi:molybdenum cofactor guanylyltransferase